MANRDSLFGSVLENSVNTGLKNNLDNAINNAGVKVPANLGLWEYPELIRKNLVSKTVTGINILGKDVVNIDISSDGDIVTYNLSTMYDTLGVDYPNFAPEDSNWGEKQSIKDIFDNLFEKILPAIRGVYAADMSTTDTDGNDLNEWNHTLFNKTGLKTGLEPTCRYIRLYLTCQAEPLFINIGNLIRDYTNGYNVKDSDTVKFKINAKNAEITAHISIIDDKQLRSIGI